MMKNFLSPFDADETLKLAIHASEHGDAHSAIRYLTELLNIQPDHGAACYFLAMQYAEIGLFERAITTLQHAVEINPTFDIAQFQLGLLYLQTQQTPQAEQIFSGLSLSSHDPALTAFSLGYLALFKEQIPNAIHHFQEGIAVCSNDALSNDIKRVIAQVENAAQNSSIPKSNNQDIAHTNHFTETQAEQTNTTTEHKTLTGFLGAYLDTIDEDNGPH
ncbi:tetratricopeptide repeat protein [Acinetobacter oleivorans]|uniref:tetratricopeptide repeat protein n=1 Tax=Acinetobacter oleivorans TaxID=1148157 RepID=UPI001D0EE1A6|nr:tetratricopeptide repeat protein [Acinetobacter oleivorans]